MISGVGLQGAAFDLIAFTNLAPETRHLKTGYF